ncbi:MAG: bifunctional UDP-N-acetylglucosamine diphosphorylase/glucosamine-1-phosphate N-acetyltransferase GlmU [Deltaproteobacteria bacterium]|nr:bifunctional UDP-N-acetylglucosamine diphosphorylase/glucosamine-1-phosphate N-acetyltransferase GlmU [Deltaproteobacteria bacterium]
MGEVLPIILAAGKGIRMASSMPKVLHKLLGRPILSYVIDAVRGLGLKRICVVVGYRAEEVMKVFEQPEIIFIEQREQLGTGHALMCCKEILSDIKGDILVLNGDTPLITQNTLKRLIDIHKNEGSLITLVISKVKQPGEYGLIIRDKEGRIKGIEEVTERNKTKQSKEINAGIYCFKKDFLEKNIPLIPKNEKKGEYYLTDLIKIASEKGEKIAEIEVPFEEVIGINNRLDLAIATDILRKNILKGLMLQGTTIIDPNSTYVESGIKIGRDSILFPGVYLSGKTTIGENTILEPGVVIRDSEIGNNVVIKAYSVITESIVEDNAKIGPFAHLRPGSHVAEEAKIGNFVEMKKSYIGRGSKASHLTYLGDAQIGNDVNIGAGTITCNYDGKRKHKTIIKDRAFIGSNTAFIAPICIGEEATVGAGSVITEDVPDKKLAIARARQVIKEKKKD